MTFGVSAQQLIEDCRMEWQPVTTAPYGVDLELAVLDGDGILALVFPCRRNVHGWVNSKSGASVGIYPSHWRQWNSGFNPVVVRPKP